MSESERDLVRRAQTGDLVAFEILAGKYSKAIYGHIFRMVRGRREEAEDLTQEALLRAFKALGRFRGDCKFSTWLRRIAVNLTLNRLQKKQLPASSIDEEPPEGGRPVEIPDESFGPERKLDQNELKRALEAAIEQLSPNLRTVFVMREVEGLSHEEIAEVLETNSQAVRVRHHRAKKQLAGILTQSMGGVTCG